MKKLLQFFQRYIDLNPEEIEALNTYSQTRSVSQNQVLLKQGEVSQEFYFIEKGCLRLFYHSKLEEKTAYFYTENSFASSYQSFVHQMPAKHNFAAVEASTLIAFDAESVRQLTTFSPKFEWLARVIMEEELAIYQEIIASFITQNAEERYLHFVKERPELLQRIPQHQIATFLGVTPETLSRIRQRILRR